MHWFWQLLGWRYYDYGTADLWLRGRRPEDLPGLVEHIRSPEGAGVHYVVDIHLIDEEIRARWPD